ncbi:MAG: hypothetical protein M1836_000104 [Candelina mexicana]|nr:MAG: hypothetical protein M1836_000104 [Candelina mexicana]
MEASRASKSDSPLPSTETNGTAAIKTEVSAGPSNAALNAASNGAPPVTREQLQAMRDILEKVYAARDEDGLDVSKVFHRKPNKRSVPDYYDVIKEPVALSTIKAKLNVSKDYKAFSEYVRHFALIFHNAQVYNRPEARAYQDALTLKSLVQSELGKLVEQGTVSAEVATFPDLGEIPIASPRAIEEEDEEDEEDEEEDDDEEADDSDEDGRRRKKRRGPRSTAAIAKREGGGSKDDGGQKGNDAESRKKRGRPPRVDTPMELRIKAVLRGVRKFKNTEGQMKCIHFERLPDKSTMPEYFEEIKVPMATEVIKKKLKRKKYQSVDQFMKDMDIMFENAKKYNTDESQIYKDAVDLQTEARIIAEQEKKKPDSEYVMEDGRLPLPNGILHNGELWRVGDWVQIQNQNDLTKPIVAQIYRTWQDADGQNWVNACWYYRPEQTVHRYERHFFENEVVKTGQYRDHNIDEVIDRCFVMFVTRYNKGRPRGFPANKEVYVCEARYNEEKHKLNKIKTWASCVPDEVRDKDYEMDLFDAPKKMKKIPSPIKHLLKDDAKEDDELPKPTWGVPNAPPIVGAVHTRPREPNDSPPPEPTPSPPPQPPPPPPRQVSNLSNHTPSQYRNDSQGDGPTGTPTQASMALTTPAEGNNAQTAYSQQYIQQYHKHSASPAPALQAAYPPKTGSYAAQPPQASYAPPQQPAHFNNYATPQSTYGYQQPAARGTVQTGKSYNPPKQPEVYHLSDSANASIPEDIREQFHRDEHGRILFYTTPPLVTEASVPKNGQALGHTVKYLAEKARRGELVNDKGEPLRHSAKYIEEKARRAEVRTKKRKHEEMTTADHDSVFLKPRLARQEIVADPEAAMTRIFMRLGEIGTGTWDKELQYANEMLYKQACGESWEAQLEHDQERFRLLQLQEFDRQEQIAKNRKEREERKKISLKSTGPFLDDIDPRY